LIFSSSSPPLPLVFPFSPLESFFSRPLLEHVFRVPAHGLLHHQEVRISSCRLQLVKKRKFPFVCYLFFVLFGRTRVRGASLVPLFSISRKPLDYTFDSPLEPPRARPQRSFPFWLSFWSPFGESANPSFPRAFPLPPPGICRYQVHFKRHNVPPGPIFFPLGKSRVLESVFSPPRSFFRVFFRSRGNARFWLVLLTGFPLGTVISSLLGPVKLM